MDQIIKNLIARLYPQLDSGLCYPRFAVVMGIADAPQDGGLCDDYRPMYAVDVQILDIHGEPDKDYPPLYSVPVSMPTGGDECGILALPKEGTQVVIQFLNGSPHKPIITAVLPLGLGLPPAGHGVSIWQGGPGAYQSASVDGDWTRTTHGTITDQSYERNINAYQSKETYRNVEKTILENDKKLVAGNKEETIAGKLTTAVSSDVTIHTASNLTISAANKLELITGNEFSEVVKNQRSIKADKLYLGDQQDNILQLFYEHMTATADMATALQLHPIAQQIEILKLKLLKMLPKQPI